MSLDNTNKHENYEILNLIGYGLSKFDMDFVREFGFITKQEFFLYLVKIDIAKTVGTVKNRQDLFDPFFDNARKGWWQKGNTYIHRKILIDSLFGSEDCKSYTSVVKLYLYKKINSIETIDINSISPILKSKFKQLQDTGKAAELFFMKNYQSIQEFNNAFLEDARTFGDGYDFQVDVQEKAFLAEIKGVKSTYGSIRLTNKEFLKAQEYRNDYVLVVVSSLEDVPKFSIIFDPVSKINFKRNIIVQRQITFNSESLPW
ncbi:DUF3883 domain-containing protein [Nostoc sp. NMS4]|uniref:DUF3883 domain-containing protein n=1 Tax=Nostoc sp. NMS4 TaxID=2815390 RepID=UPI0025E2043C|nr:DUF3883 domain-containing protein [Nostoc sp. NMS4]MBN3925640.1 DUF3883 domain-containing protein [Nostoc sp. NMS4]